MGSFKQFIKQATEYVMRSRREAALFALLFTIIPLFGWVGATIMALVTLRHGAREGLIVLLCTTIPSAALAFFGYHEQFVYNVLACNVIIWLLALVLRRTQSWQQVLQVGCLLGIIIVIGLHLVIGDISQYWYQWFNNYYKDAETMLAVPVNKAQMQSLFLQMARIWTGVQAAIFLLINISTLGVARWLQDLLYNPGGFSQEVYQIRLGWLANVLLALVLAGVVLGNNLAWDLLPLPLMIFFLAGLSFLHAIFARSNKMWLWIIVFYLLLIVFYVYIFALVVIIGIVDSWFDIRAKLANISR